MKIVHRNMAKAILYLITALLTQSAVSSSSFTVIDVKPIGEPTKTIAINRLKHLPLLDHKGVVKNQPAVVVKITEPVTVKPKVSIKPESVPEKNITSDPVIVTQESKSSQPETVIPPTIKKPTTSIEETVVPVSKPISTVPPSIALPTGWQPKKRQSINAVIRKYMGKDNEVPQ